MSALLHLPAVWGRVLNRVARYSIHFVQWDNSLASSRIGGSSHCSQSFASFSSISTVRPMAHFLIQNSRTDLSNNIHINRLRSYNCTQPSNLNPSAHPRLLPTLNPPIAPPDPSPSNHPPSQSSHRQRSLSQKKNKHLRIQKPHSRLPIEHQQFRRVELRQLQTQRRNYPRFY